MDPQRIRPIAICLVRRGDRILVLEDQDRVKGDRFCRPLGGAVEFSERSRDTVTTPRSPTARYTSATR